jgi:hypothetical protein
MDAANNAPVSAIESASDGARFRAMAGMTKFGTAAARV